MNNNNQVIIERDMYCPYCKNNSAVIISETVKGKKLFGCAPIGLKNGCLLAVTGGCWAIISGIPLYDVKEEYQNNIYGFCPCCGNTYPVLKPEAKTIIDSLQHTHDRFSHVVNQAKGFVDNIQNGGNNGNNNNNNYNNNNYNNNNNNYNNNNNNYNNNNNNYNNDSNYNNNNNFNSDNNYNNNNNFNNNGGDFNNNNNNN